MELYTAAVSIQLLDRRLLDKHTPPPAVHVARKSLYTVLSRRPTEPYLGEPMMHLTIETERWLECCRFSGVLCVPPIYFIFARKNK